MSETVGSMGIQNSGMTAITQSLSRNYIHTGDLGGASIESVVDTLLYTQSNSR